MSLSSAQVRAKQPHIYNFLCSSVITYLDRSPTKRVSHAFRGLQYPLMGTTLCPWATHGPAMICPNAHGSPLVGTPWAVHGLPMDRNERPSTGTSILLNNQLFALVGAFKRRTNRSAIPSPNPKLIRCVLDWRWVAKF